MPEKSGFESAELLAQPLDMAVDGAVGDESVVGVALVHQLASTLDMPGWRTSASRMRNSVTVSAPGRRRGARCSAAGRAPACPARATSSSSAAGRPRLSARRRKGTLTPGREAPASRMACRGSHRRPARGRGYGRTPRAGAEEDDGRLSESPRNRRQSSRPSMRGMMMSRRQRRAGRAGTPPTRSGRHRSPRPDSPRAQGKGHSLPDVDLVVDDRHHAA